MSKKTITRADLANALACELDMQLIKAKPILTSILTLMSNAIIQENKLKLTKFGTFNVIYKKVRRGNDFKGEKQALITARKVISFKPSLYLKHQTNDEK